MKCVLCRRFGPPDTLTIDDVPEPGCGPGSVRIRVHAAGVNFPDTLIIEGKYQLRPEPPFTPGAEVAGVVDAIGTGVAGLAPGDRVMALTGWGGFAEMVEVEARRAMKIPDTMDFPTAAGFAMTYGTSMHALRQRARLAPGETLLVLGAGGGVGLTAVELGRTMGATVIAAAGSAEKLEAARAAGATHRINTREESLRDRLKAITAGRGVDVVYDPVGGDLFDESLRSLAWNGRLLVIGFASGRIPQAPVNLPLLKGAAIVGVYWGAFRQHEPEEDRRNFDDLFAWHAEGRLRPRIDRLLPLDRAAEALNALRARTVTGKIVLTVDG
ncbi:NADPH:quinone oxidoreductase family protein [Azospirillum sp. TSO22-1]|uniref:NADPH:quinone oxidoreductase family protein n=1 Tax=Azospirillum sp. TSO22-1 TaxID=716789 RepID=UPI000D617D54|nr:NADPH:quinone oxidoreductase family protein [Azospirillum sp. TSO22-1]PWC31719.1 NADPH:quinone oxidoreductase [Azospirillum sp. TSO22-1]